MTGAWPWIIFNLFVIVMLALDLGVFHRGTKEIKVKDALIWTTIWITLALIFCFGIYHFTGKEKGLEFLAGYVIEKSLSVDNIFVFMLIFSYFNVPAQYQHKVLFWGIIGALIMRALLIVAGIALIERFHQIIYVFAAFLVFTGVRMFFQRDEKTEPEKNFLIRFLRKVLPVSPEFHEGNFFVRLNGRLYVTLLFIVVITVEVSDLVFAVDSIPAILAVSEDPFIVYTSNVFAILGLRSLYFALAGLHDRFAYFKYGLALILVFVGVKMFLTDIYKIPVWMALTVIVTLLLGSTLFSVFMARRNEKK
jgi:tellurite resistance protein TerC